MLLFTREGAAHSSKYQDVLPKDRVRGVGGSLYPGHHYPENGDSPTLLGFPLHPVSPLHGVGLAWVHGVGGEADLAGALGSAVLLEQGNSPPWSLSFCARTYAPVRTPLTPFHDWLLFCVEMATPSWA